MAAAKKVWAHEVEIHNPATHIRTGLSDLDMIVMYVVGSILAIGGSIGLATMIMAVFK